MDDFLQCTTQGSVSEVCSLPDRQVLRRHKVCQRWDMVPDTVMALDYPGTGSCQTHPSS